MNHLLSLGALDVTFNSIQMKKNRPAIALQVMVKDNDLMTIIEEIFKHSGTLGLRISNSDRLICNREIKWVDTEYGRIKIKTASFQGKLIKVKPEFEDCKRIAKEYNLSIKDVQQLALRIFSND